METDNIPILGTVTVDKSQVPPIHQKRILAFVNHFITSTCSFLNEFIYKCENKFIDLERKLQRVEASLIIIEAKLASIPGLEPAKTTIVLKEETEVIAQKTTREEVYVMVAVPEEITTPPATELIEPEVQPVGVTASNDTRYRKYFKMLQFGVPPQAVKMKMSAEGCDPAILDSPNKILPDGIQHEAAGDG